MFYTRVLDRQEKGAAWLIVRLEEWQTGGGGDFRRPPIKVLVSISSFQVSPRILLVVSGGPTGPSGPFNFLRRLGPFNVSLSLGSFHVVITHSFSRAG